MATPWEVIKNRRTGPSTRDGSGFVLLQPERDRDRGALLLAGERRLQGVEGPPGGQAPLHVHRRPALPHRGDTPGHGLEQDDEGRRPALQGIQGLQGERHARLRHARPPGRAQGREGARDQEQEANRGVRRRQLHRLLPRVRQEEPAHNERPVHPLRRLDGLGEPLHDDRELLR